MPWRLILFIIFLVCISLFIGYNLENACNVNFGFKQFDNVPVYLTVLFSVVAGVLITIPFTFSHMYKEKKSSKIKKETMGFKEKTISEFPRDSPQEEEIKYQTQASAEKTDLPKDPINSKPTSVPNKFFNKFFGWDDKNQ